QNLGLCRHLGTKAATNPNRAAVGVLADGVAKDDAEPAASLFTAQRGLVFGRAHDLCCSLLFRDPNSQAMFVNIKSEQRGTHKMTYFWSKNDSSAKTRAVHL